MKKFLLTLLAIGLMTIPAYLIAQLYYYNTYATLLELESAMSGSAYISIPFEDIKEFFFKIWIVLGAIITCISIVTVRTNPNTTPTAPAQTSYNHCDNCGTALNENNRFCPKCGKQIK